MIYTTILHDVRRRFGLTLNEYCIADLIDKLAFNASNPQQWCYATKENIAQELGLSKQTVLTIIETLITAGIVEKHEFTKHLRTTNLWAAALRIMPEQSLQVALPLVKKLYQPGKETLPEAGKETLPYINNVDINNYINKNKDLFFKKIIDYRDTHINKYPKGLYDKFFGYWTEHNNDISKSVKQIKMRFEEEKFFEIGRRLSTFWRNTNSQEKQSLWAQHNLKINGTNELQQGPQKAQQTGN